MITEQQATHRWCPFSRVIGQKTFGAGNRINVETVEGRANIPLGSCCLGARCMAWVTETRLFHIASGEFVEPGKTVLMSGVEERPTGRGRCGLVGRSA